MSADSILATSKVIVFAPTKDPVTARAFYEGVLGLRLIQDEAPFALVFDANGIMLRLSIGSEAPQTGATVLGWKVTDIESTAESLKQAGVTFARYPFLEQDELGIWTAPGGARVAWFQDPDGNTLSISQHEA